MKEGHLFLKGCVMPLFLLFSLLMMQTGVHEEVHRAIYSDYGINSTVEIHGLSGTCTPDPRQWNFLPRERRDAITASQAANEVASGFQIIMIFIASGFQIMMIFIFTMWCAVRKL